MSQGLIGATEDSTTWDSFSHLAYRAHGGNSTFGFREVDSFCSAHQYPLPPLTFLVTAGSIPVPRVLAKSGSSWAVPSASARFAPSGVRQPVPPLHKCPDRRW